MYCSSRLGSVRLIWRAVTPGAFGSSVAVSPGIVVTTKKKPSSYDRTALNSSVWDLNWSKGAIMWDSRDPLCFALSPHYSQSVRVETLCQLRCAQSISPDLSLGSHMMKTWLSNLIAHLARRRVFSPSAPGSHTCRSRAVILISNSGYNTLTFALLVLTWTTWNSSPPLHHHEHSF